MGSRSRQHQKDDEEDWDSEEEDTVDMEEELEIEFDGDDDDAAGDSSPTRRGGAWRLIEQATEQRMLRMALEDFDDYVV